MARARALRSLRSCLASSSSSSMARAPCLFCALPSHMLLLPWRATAPLPLPAFGAHAFSRPLLLLLPERARALPLCGGLCCGRSSLRGLTDCAKPCASLSGNALGAQAAAAAAPVPAASPPLPPPPISSVPHSCIARSGNTCSVGVVSNLVLCSTPLSNRLSTAADPRCFRFATHHGDSFGFRRLLLHAAQSCLLQPLPVGPNPLPPWPEGQRLNALPSAHHPGQRHHAPPSAHHPGQRHHAPPAAHPSGRPASPRSACSASSASSGPRGLWSGSSDEVDAMTWQDGK